MSPSPRSRAFARFVLSYGKWLWLVALALFAPAAWRMVAMYANLHSDFEELLPKDAPSVVAIDELRTRAPGLQHLGVVVDTGNAENLAAGERFIDDLAARIQTYPPDLVAAVRTGTTEERTFLKDHAPLYADLADLKAIRARLEARRDWDVARVQGTSLDDDEPAPSVDFSDLQAKYESRGRSKMPEGRFSNAQLHTTLLLVEVGGTGGSASKSKELLGRVKADVDALGGPAHYAAGMRVGYTAEVATAVEETEALMTDLGISSVFVLLAVGAAIMIYFWWARSVAVLVVPLLLATAYAFALASLPPFSVHALNSNTAFLGSIIVGNGINFGIVLLARYVEERRRGVAIEDAWAVAINGARPGTLAAALAASASYAALAFTQFQGFRQFGMIGGLGMLTSWGVAFLLVPSLAAWLDGGKLSQSKKPRVAIMPFVADFVRRRATVIAVVAVALTMVAALEARTFDRSRLETDFSKLRRADTWTNGEGYWSARMDAVLGEYLTPMAVLSDSPAEGSLVAARLRAAQHEPEMAGLLAQVRTLSDVVPTEQEEKIREARAIREDLTPRLRASLDDRQRAHVDDLLGKEDLRPITVDDVPHTLTTGLRERVGESGKIVLVYPALSDALWQGEALGHFVSVLRTESTAATTSAGGRPARVAGGLPLTSDILASIEHDGPRVTLLAFAGVVLVVVVLFRTSRATVEVLASLVVGVLWMLAATMVMGAKVNFANFIAFPITFGIGVDYSVNVVSRAREDRDVMSAIRSTGAAVGLCSLTTVIGYSSLLLAENRALFLFGLFAVMGEIACITTAVVVLPAMLLAWERRGQPKPAVR